MNFVPYVFMYQIVRVLAWSRLWYTVHDPKLSHFKKKLQKNVTIWEHLPKRHYFWIIINQKKRKKMWQFGVMDCNCQLVIGHKYTIIIVMYSFSLFCFVKQILEWNIFIKYIYENSITEIEMFHELRLYLKQSFLAYTI